MSFSIFTEETGENTASKKSTKWDTNLHKIYQVGLKLILDLPSGIQTYMRICFFVCLWPRLVFNRIQLAASKSRGDYSLV